MNALPAVSVSKTAYRRVLVGFDKVLPYNPLFRRLPGKAVQSEISDHNWMSHVGMLRPISLPARQIPGRLGGACSDQFRRRTGSRQDFWGVLP